MKRMAIGIFAVLLTVALASPAFAADLKMTGGYGVAFIHKDTFKKEGDNIDRFWVHQSSNVVFNFSAGEDVKSVFRIGTPNSLWGSSKAGLGYNADDTADRRLRLQQSFVDWKFGKTGLSARIGVQPIRFPGFAAGTPVFNYTTPGVTLGAQLGNVGSLNLSWMRLLDNGGNAAGVDIDEEFDLFYLSAPIKTGGITILPWAAYGMIGRQNTYDFFAAQGYATGATGYSPLNPNSGSDLDLMYAGISGDLNFGNVFLKADAMYGSLEPKDDNADVWKEAKGYYLAAKAGAKLGFGTPAFTGWYTSGNDDDDMANGKLGVMPSLTPDGDPSFIATSAGAWGCAPQTTGFLVSSTGIGTAGVALAVEDMSFAERMFHTVRVAYWTGTSAKGSFRNPTQIRAGGGLPIDEKDSVIELNLDSRYKVSDNTSVFVDLGYLKADWDQKGPGQRADEWNDDAYRFALSLQFAF